MVGVGVNADDRRDIEVVETMTPVGKGQRVGERHVPAVADDRTTRRFLVVANQTLGSAHLVEKVKECLAESPSQFHVLVPATPPELMSPPVDAEAAVLAQQRLDEALTRFEALGASVTGEVGAPIVVLAISDVLRRKSFDEIIVSTLPTGKSRWLRQGIRRRLAVAFHTPVTLLTAPAPNRPR